jgi:hypothetical protein
MSLSVSFRHSARAEFIEAAAWYESERQNLGVDFIAEIERALRQRPAAPLGRRLTPDCHLGYGLGISFVAAVLVHPQSCRSVSVARTHEDLPPLALGTDNSRMCRVRWMRNPIGHSGTNQDNAVTEARKAVASMC